MPHWKRTSSIPQQIHKDRLGSSSSSRVWAVLVWEYQVEYSGNVVKTESRNDALFWVFELAVVQKALDSISISNRKTYGLGKYHKRH